MLELGAAPPAGLHPDDLSFLLADLPCAPSVPPRADADLAAGLQDLSGADQQELSDLLADLSRDTPGLPAGADADLAHLMATLPGLP